MPPLQIIPATRALVLSAAHIKASYPIAYADAFAVACARQHPSTILTGDAEFRSMEEAGLIRIEWLPR